jgi:lysophospholipase L1-like esterase
MKKILCYGDSNTYGHNPADCSRLEVRWTKVLAEKLGSDYEIVEEGLCGRTTVLDDHFDYGLNGKAMLEPTLKTHNPLDLIILMLGTNDIQLQFNQTAYDISRGAEALVKIIKNPMIYGNYEAPQLLLVSPILIDESIKNSFFADLFGAERAVKISEKLAIEYKRVADLHNVHFLNAADYAKASTLDGLHMNSENHILLANALADKIKEIL